MASSAPYPGTAHHLSPYHPDDDAMKASYDDLIDEYAQPYSKNSAHQTFAVDPAQPSSHRRGPSYPLQHHPSYSTDFASTEDGHPRKGVGNEFGYPPSPPQTKETPSFWAKIMPDSIACRLYVLTVVIETTIDLAIEGDLLLRLHESHITDTNDVTSRKMPVYLGIFAFAHLFQFILAVDAVYARNTLQFIFLTLFNALFLVYAIIQIGEIQRTLEGTTAADGVTSISVNFKVLTTIIPVVISVAELAYIALGWKIYNEFGWKVYKFLGADRQIKRMYATHQIFECLVKFDVFFWVGFSVQFIWIILQKMDWEYYVTVAALPLSILLLIEGHLAARHENKLMMLTFMAGCAGGLIYFIYKLFKVVANRKNDEFVDVWASLTTFSLIAILLLVATFISAFMVMRNFGRGLKDQLAKNRKNGHGRWASQGPSKMPMSANPYRMSID